MAKLNLFISLISSNQADLVVVVQATTVNAANRIAKNGFGVVSTLDPGWYGQGIYFTSKVQYAREYTKEGAYLISLVIPGKSFPVAEIPKLSDPESLMGKPCKPSYDSHFTQVDDKGFPETRENLNSETFDELVIFEPSQALPLLLVFCDNPKSNGSMRKEGHRF